MKLNNHKNGIINYGTPFGRAFGTRRRRWSALNYNDRSPELWAMNAYLRVSAHREKDRTSTNSLADSSGRTATATGSFVNLLRAYDNQVSANFTRKRCSSASSL